MKKLIRCVRKLPGRLLLHPGSDRPVEEGDELELDDVLAEYLVERGDFELVVENDGGGS